MPCQIKNKSNFDISEIEDLIQDLYSFSSSKFGFKEDPTLILVSDDQNTSPLGKTAHYDPSSMEITVFVDGRHPKDIMRSFSHELIHHNQNLKGEFANIVGQGGSNYAQTNPHLRKMEKEAYLKGNMCFRDWEDGYKSSNPNILNERRIYKMSIKDWKDKELNTLLNEKWGFSMNLGKLNENKKPDFPDVDGDGDRKEPISKAQKDKKAKGGEDKPKKKAKKGEIPPQLRNHVKGKQKDEEDSEESEEELNEISMGHGTDGRGPDVNLKQAKNNLKNVGNPPKKDKKNKEKKDLKEGESELEEIKAMVKQNFESEELDDATINQIANMIKAKRDKNKPPPQSGGNSGSGAPAQASLQEQKLRRAVRKIIKRKLKK